MKPLSYKTHVWYFPNASGMTETEYFNAIVFSLETEIEKTDVEIKALTRKIRLTNPPQSVLQNRTDRKHRRNLKEFRKILVQYLELMQK